VISTKSPAPGSWTCSDTILSLSMLELGAETDEFAPRSMYDPTHCIASWSIRGFSSAITSKDTSLAMSRGSMLPIFAMYGCRLPLISWMIGGLSLASTPWETSCWAFTLHGLALASKLHTLAHDFASRQSQTSLQCVSESNIGTQLTGILMIAGEQNDPP
jgi:hypothetical protein